MDEFKRIMVPLDGSSLAENALPQATALARKFNSHIILIRVLDFHHFTLPSSQFGDTLVKARQEAYRDIQDYLKAKEDKLAYQGLNVQSLVDDRSPAQAIIETAKNQGVDLIVMSTHGRGGLARWAFGSVADKVVRHSPCPVFIIPPHDRGGIE